MPACIEYVLKHSPTKADKLHWMGHSMVSNSLLLALSPAAVHAMQWQCTLHLANLYHLLKLHSHIGYQHIGYWIFPVLQS